MSHSSFLRRFAAADGAPPTARQLYKAFDLLGSDFNYDEEREGALEQLAGFTRRWGKPSLDNLLEIARRFAPGQPRPAPEPQTKMNRMAVVHPTREEMAYVGPDTSGEADTTFALATLSVIRNPEAPDALAPYLASPYAVERWLAVIGLVAMHDERALPIVESLLVEFVGPLPPGRPDLSIGYIFEYLRSYLLRLLADWGDPRVVSPIRAGLIANVRAEEIAVPDPTDPDPEFVWNGRYYTGPGVERRFYGSYHEQLEWVHGEHEFVYVLGRMGAFGALEGIPTRRGNYSRQMALTSEGGGEAYFEPCLPESHAEGFRANVWRVLMCFGALESQFCGHLETTFDFSEAPELAAAVDQMLAGNFGMDEATRHRAMEDFDQASWTYWTVILYGWKAESARERAMLEEGGGEDESDEMEETEPYDPPEISLEDREAQDFGWEDQW
jgi:hypothetical protein